MKIAFINDTFGTGSIGRLTKELAQSLIEYGNDVRYYYAQGIGNEDYAIKISSRTGQRLHAVLSRITGLQGYFSTIKTHQLVRQLEEFSPDVVHLQNLHSNYINLRILGEYLKKNRIPTVITLHDCWFYTGKCTCYIPANCEKWMSGCGQCPLLHCDNVNPTIFFDTTSKCIRDKEAWFASNNKLAVVGVSQWVTNEARRSIYKNSHIECIYNWVDQDVFCYRENANHAKLGLPRKKNVLMVSTCLSEKKGYNELLYIADALSEEYQVVYIGRNKQNLPIPANVIHVPHTDSADQLSEYYSIADVCVNTTQYETFGMVTVEAMSCGTPVIVYNNTASPELVGEGCGIVVDQKSDIVEAISKITQWNRDLTRKACISWSQKKFNRQNGIGNHIALYKTLVGEKSE